MKSLEVQAPDEKAALPNVRHVTSAAEIESNFAPFLSDESKLRGTEVRELWFPLNVKDVSLILARNYREGIPSRVSGARSGLAGAAVPEAGECIISLEKMKTISTPELDEARGVCTVRVQPGVSLHELNSYLSEWGGGWYFPVDPTETSASIGGMVSTNASGARSYHFGATRAWVQSATVVLVDGGVLRLSRGADKLNGNTLRLRWQSEERTLTLDPVRRPPTKSTLGYLIEPNEAVLDLFIGAEGTLGVVAEIELLLAKIPTHRLSYMQFFASDETALSFVDRLRARGVPGVLAIEFIDKHSLGFAVSNPRGAKTPLAQLVTPQTEAAVYIEVSYETEDELGEIYAQLEEILAGIQVSMDQSYAGVEEKELREIKVFRHAVPEQINATIAVRKNSFPELHKIATDMAVPNSELLAIYRLYRDTLESAGLEFAIFGHAGNNHFHVNLLPRNTEELKLGKEVYKAFAAQVVKSGGAVAAEHGIGRLKREFLELQFGAEELKNLRSVKEFFDPRGLLNKGVLFFDAK